MILLDLVMPGINGFAFLEEIAKHPEWRAREPHNVWAEVR
jgi:CheY-like chemotaxis protein